VVDSGAGLGRHHRVLVVEDAPDLRRLIVTALIKDGFVVETSDNGQGAIHRARAFEPDVIVLDLGLPVLDGIEVCRQVRTFSDAYILMLTGRDDEVDKIVGLSVGADDYVTKPFSVRELIARIRAMLRRARPRRSEDGDHLRQFGDLIVDVASREVTVEGAKIDLTKIEFDLLDTLTSQPRAVFTRSRLMAIVWGPDWYGDDHVVDVHISKLRRKLGESASAQGHIRTVRGVGFRFEPRT
jgi:DNA-binding response OmpR family regulator